MGKFFDKDGQEVEAFTQDELNSKITERETALKTEHDTAINKLKEDHKTELETATTEAGKGGKKSDKKDEESEAIAALRKEIDALKTGKVNDKKEALLNQLAGNDKDLRAKLEHEYNQFNADDTSESAIESRMLKSFNLVNPEARADTIKSAVSAISASKGRDTSGAENQVKTDEQKALAKNFGISEDDEKKYGASVDAALNSSNGETK